MNSKATSNRAATRNDGSMQASRLGATRNKAASLMLALLMMASMIPAGALTAFAQETATPEVQATSEQGSSGQATDGELRHTGAEQSWTEEAGTQSAQTDEEASPAAIAQDASPADDPGIKPEEPNKPNSADEGFALSRASVAVIAKGLNLTLLETVSVPYVNASGAAQTPVTATVVESGTTTWSSGDWYVVNSTVTINDRITVSGTVNLILADNGSLTASAGINVISIDSLTIWAQSGGTGQLTANGGSNNAGIGGGSGQSANGIITINGGVITANGGMHGAGIGGGSGGGGSYITINGGVISATGGDYGAGIGGGMNGAGGAITINSGAVTANGGTNGAGIGGGDNGAGGDITINGGMVTATGESTAQDIGNGVSGGVGAVKITGGSVNPTNGQVSPQPTSNGSTLVYLNTLTVGASANEQTNAAVTAVGGDISGYGINGVKTDSSGKVYFWLPVSAVLQSVRVTVGGRVYGDSFVWPGTNTTTEHRLTLKSYGTVIDMSDTNPQSFGTGWTYNSGTYTIQDGADVTVIGSNAGSQRRLEVASSATNVKITLDNVTIAGLNSGQSPLSLGSNASAALTLTGTNSLTAGNARAGIQAGNGTTLTTDGEGTLTAQGGQYAAGIGGGDNVNGGNIIISGGTVNAQGGQYAAGIGGGRAQAGGNIIINGGAVTANGGSGAAGIGGGSSGAGGTITINGGAVTANGGSGGSGAAGIGGGGGEQGNGGTITISGGTVTATGSGGDDIGKSGDPISSNGTVKITGGSVKATQGLITQPTDVDAVNVYLNTLTIGGTAQTAAAVTAASGALSGYGINGVVTDSAGKVYFWLPASASGGTAAEEVTVTANTTTYKNTFRRGTSAVEKTLRENYTGWSATAADGASGTANTTAITFTFSPGVTGLSASDITVADNGGSVTKGTLTDTSGSAGTSYSLAVTTSAQGNITVSVPDKSATAFGPDASVTVAVYKVTQTPEAQPSAAIDYVAEKLTGLANGTYSVTPGAGSAESVTIANATLGANGTYDIPAAWLNTSLSIVRCGNGTSTTDSAAQSLPIPARPGAPNGVDKTDCSVPGADNGTLTGTSTAMEYRLATAGNWSDCGDTSVTGLAAGTYYVRIKAISGESGSFAGTATSGLVISDGTTPQPTIYHVTSPFGTFTGSGTATASIDADYSKFRRLLYNGQAVDPAHYTATSGSTIITLSEAHLKGYANGTHTFIAEFSDGASEAIMLTVAVPNAAPSTPATSLPGTGESGTPFVWTLLLAALGVALVAVSLLRRRTERALQPRALQPRALQPRGLKPQGLHAKR